MVNRAKDIFNRQGGKNQTEIPYEMSYLTGQDIYRHGFDDNVFKSGREIKKRLSPFVMKGK